MKNKTKERRKGGRDEDDKTKRGVMDGKMERERERRKEEGRTPK